MPNSDTHAQIARKIRTIETSKIELVQQVAEIMRSIHSGNERDIARALGGLVGIAYFLGGQMGVPLQTIDNEVLNGLPRTLSGDADIADFQSIERHLNPKR